MQLSDIWGALRRRWAFAVVPLIAAVALGFYTSSTAPEVYRATTQAYVALPIGKTANDLFQGSNFAQQQLASFAALATTPAVLEPVIEKLDLDMTPQKLAGDVQVTASSDTVILEISARASTAQGAADIANQVNSELAKKVKSMPPRLENGDPSVEIAEVGSAVAPLHPISPDKRRDMIAAVLGGSFIGFLAALVRDRTDTRVRGRHDIPEGVNLLGTVPFDASIKKSGPAAITNAGSQARGEAYRRVRTTLRFADVDNPVQVFEVTSALPGEGKSTSALNLAQVFASAGGRVLLVDADLRKPRIADYLGIVGSVGLVDVLIGRARLDDVLQKVLDGRLTVLPCGTIPPNPTELLGSRAMMTLMGELRQRFDIVVFDTPPLLPVVDAAVLAPLIDGALVVSRYGKTTRAQLSGAVGSLDAVATRVLGVLLTCAKSGRKQRSAYGDYYRDPPSNPPTRSRRGASTRSGRSTLPAAGLPHGGRESATVSTHLAQRPPASMRMSSPAPMPSPFGDDDAADPPPDDDSMGDFTVAQAVVPRSGQRPFRPPEAGPSRTRGSGEVSEDDDMASDVSIPPEDSTHPRRRARRAAAESEARISASLKDPSDLDTH